jgi:hypothetical protein
VCRVDFVVIHGACQEASARVTFTVVEAVVAWLMLQVERQGRSDGIRLSRRMIERPERVPLGEDESTSLTRGNTTHKFIQFNQYVCTGMDPFAADIDPVQRLCLGVPHGALA